MKLDHIVILLTDLKTGVEFYDVLLPLIGFTKTRDHVFGNHEEVYLDFRQAGDTEHGYRRHATGLNHLGFNAEKRKDLETLRTAMANAGFDAPEIQEFSDGSAVFFRDEDGMRIEVGCSKDNTAV